LKRAIRKKIIRKVFFYYIKRNNIALIKKIVLLPFINKEGYWVVQKLLNHGYLNDAYILLMQLPYKSHFDYIFRRVNSMMEIKVRGARTPSVKKKFISSPIVLFVVHNSLPYDKAGYAIRTQQIATTFKKFNIKLSVVTRPGYPWDLLKHRNLDKKNNSQLEDIEYIRLEDKEHTFKRGADLEYIEIYAKKIEEIAESKGTNIIHAHSNFLNGLAGAKAANKLKIPFIYEIRGLWHMTRLTINSSYKYKGMYMYEEEMEKSAARASDAVIVLSESLKRLVMSWGVDYKKIHVVPSVVDSNKFTPKSRNEILVKKYQLKDKIVIGFLGTLASYEGIREIIVACDELIEEGYNIALMIVGEGREKDNLEKIAKSKNIIFTGRVSFDEVEAYYSLFDICPFPRNNLEVCHYIPPLKVLEAMSMEKAIIVSNVAPLIEIIENNSNGLVCSADDINSLKDKICHLYNNDKTRERLGKNARIWVKNNRSVEEMSKRYKSVYDFLKK
jgi:glycosyltransferase involved in cell wall biosynthesis